MLSAVFALVPSFGGCVLFYRHVYILKMSFHVSIFFCPFVCLVGAGFVEMLAFQALLLVDIDHFHVMFFDARSHGSRLCFEARKHFATAVVSHRRRCRMTVYHGQSCRMLSRSLTYVLACFVMVLVCSC